LSEVWFPYYETWDLCSYFKESLTCWHGHALSFLFSNKILIIFYFCILAFLIRSLLGRDYYPFFFLCLSGAVGYLVVCLLTLRSYSAGPWLCLRLCVLLFAGQDRSLLRLRGTAASFALAFVSHLPSLSLSAFAFGGRDFRFEVNINLFFLSLP
jgi:hypothetical protein